MYGDDFLPYYVGGETAVKFRNPEYHPNDGLVFTSTLPIAYEGR